MTVLEVLLFCSYINLLAMLPLFSSRRLAEHMSGNLDQWYSWLISSPGWMALAVILATSGIAWKLTGTGEQQSTYQRAIAVNSLLMIVCWVLPSACGASDWLQMVGMEIWAIASGLFLLFASFLVPVKALRRALKG